MSLSKTIAIANDHGGCELSVELVNHLEKKGYNIINLGVAKGVTADYPDQAALMAETILSKKSNKGILICGTGIGISIAANRYPGIYAALCNNEYSAAMARKHNNSNVIVFGARTMGVELVKSMLDTWLSSEFEGGRHSVRVDKIDSNVEKLSNNIKNN